MWSTAVRVPSGAVSLRSCEDRERGERGGGKGCVPNRRNKHTHMRARAVLVLDLDHTLVHSVPRGTRGVPFAFEHFDVTLANGVEYTTYVRPHLKTLLAVVEAQRDWMRTIVWTAGTREYATAILDGLGMGNVDAFTRDDAYVLPSGRFSEKLGSGRAQVRHARRALVGRRCGAQTPDGQRGSRAPRAGVRRDVPPRGARPVPAHVAMEISGVAAQGRAALKNDSPKVANHARAS